MLEMFSLENKTAIITGGNRGLGEAMSLGLAEAGANVVVIARNENPELEEKIKGLGRKYKMIPMDLSDISKFEEVVESINKEFGSVDILINNAGVQKRHPSVEFPEEDWDFVLNVNTKAVFFLCQAVGKKMIEQGKGKIVNIASLLSFQGGFTVPAYAASKGAVMQFTKSLSNEWAKSGVNVNGIAPGYMATEMNTAIMADKARNEQISQRIPAGRWGKPEDLVGAAIFLSSNASDYINGEIIVVDGGWMGR
ncbi:2-dehydro-3-deoxy-D-gluconate 5-dehydrogenase KduD [Clostridium beijerinckii]|uniref:2-dehydro-3-deoxy-D-gluconate 5-dehydrogenase KduD n=1 Tax=Clostridium beijerinckii TaxID=1520 RepID=UPI001361DB75|nr:2-dehydro-3-deoxy-D-gluconate 5-dehydrogenase KduD [Clostridium beijerinckii]MZK52055.1 2-dehydro-3-deoxy-D-gluconate 5-dehydrogenase KduD [Clostridium beijerinckii]MZK60196.1 2-dehydro-3-deoxy-D-gluconate 5-dehydrogenase KduD [Clostridium beijerinckii]MZK70481.1 2-dehydro-3-deoxy-D-gluconate 5-dehydrogenase KduD [Clostridium beijerinckii]MZK75783.1 2-dehydro-3-deoxy-D-gluconate 5-dehydrogenase KduD [Clostridium beijerinckii]MZK85447.1 2-dehydro-3-deoxy-D-gluconate 5-dehydrogenase KduD [Clo